MFSPVGWALGGPHGSASSQADARSELAGSWLVTHCSLTLAAKEKIIVVFVLCFFFSVGYFLFFLCGQVVHGGL